MTDATITTTENEIEEVRLPLQPPSDPLDNEKSTNLFKEIDQNHDGFISKHEFLNSSLKKIFTPQELERIFQNGDLDHDGRINYREFAKLSLKLCGKKYLNFIVAPVPRKKADIPNEQLYEIRWTCKPPKLGMLAITLMEIVFFIIDSNVEGEPMKKAFRYDSCRRHEVWRFLTYTLVHSGQLHLVANLIVQLFFGIPLEMYHGWWRILLIYLSGVITGSLGTSIMDPRQNLVGASGGVYALLTAHIANIIMNWSQLKRGTYPGLQLFILLIITCTDLGTSISERYVDKVDLHVGYAAHLMGAVAGLLVGIAILRNIKINRHEKVIWWLAAILYAILVVVGVFWNTFGSKRYFSKYC